MKKSKFWDRFTKSVGIVLLVAFIVLFLIPVGCMVYNVNIVSERYMEVASFFLTILSLFLGAYSVWSAWSGGKTTDRMVSKLDRLISGQESIKGALNNSPAKTQGSDGGSWDGGNDGYHD